MAYELVCAACGHAVKCDYSDRCDWDGVPCPACSSPFRVADENGVVRLSVSDNLSVKVLELIELVLKQTDPTGLSRSARKKGILEVTQGLATNVKGEPIEVSIRIDRLKKRYRKVLTTLDGKFVKFQDQPLSDHTGHGSDKPSS